MIRAAGWTMGLFSLGAGVVHLFPGPWTEPLVLIALGAALVAVSRRPTAPARDGDEVPEARAVPASTRAVR